jgi:cyclase
MISRVTLGVVLVAGAAAAQEPDFSKVEVKTVPVAGSVSMLAGFGGNIGVSVGPDGAFVIDDDYAPLTSKVKAAIAALGNPKLRFVLNTHWHGDHSGGNEGLGEAGALIVAHDNVRARMSTEQFMRLWNEKVPASSPKALPVVTFSDAVTFHLNGDEVHAFHVPPAHTDGDAIVHFRKADVIHMGDTFFNGMYPFIDLDTGGNLAGMIAAVDRVLAMAKPSTKIIPGHGPLASRADLEGYRAMLVAVRDRVAEHVKAGRTAEQIKAAAPLKDLDAKWGNGFMKPEMFLSLVVADLSRGK